MGHKSDRANDETLLRALAMRCAGAGASEIAARLRFTRPEAVRIAINRVRAADLEESGEPAAAVLAAYTWSENGGRRAG